MHHLRFWLSETFSHFACARVGNVLSLVGITACLWILGASGLFLSQMRRTLDVQTSRLELVVLLDKRISPARRRQIFEAARIKAVKKLELTLASAALKRYSSNLKLSSDDLRAAHPLGDELRVELHDPHDFWKVRAYLTSIQGVMGARNSHIGASIPRLWRVWHTLRLAALGAFLVGSLIVVVLVRAVLGRTRRLRGREIQVMKLVGATPAFIGAPFWIQGVLLGVAGAALASTKLNAGANALKSALGLDSISFVPIESVAIVASVLGIGVLAGVCGAWLALRGVNYEVARAPKTRMRVVKDAAK